jgi:hypothetical protein
VRCGRWYGVLPDRSQVPVLADGVEAGALLAEIEIEMARDDGIREVGVETLNELAKNSNLFGCTSVFDSPIEMLRRTLIVLNIIY